MRSSVSVARRGVVGERNFVGLAARCVVLAKGGVPTMPSLPGQPSPAQGRRAQVQSIRLSSLSVHAGPVRCGRGAGRCGTGLAAQHVVSGAVAAAAESPEPLRRACRERSLLAGADCGLSTLPPDLTCTRGEQIKRLARGLPVPPRVAPVWPVTPRTAASTAHRAATAGGVVALHTAGGAALRCPAVAGFGGREARRPRGHEQTSK